ncbi:receptor-like serine-threonine protein kinase precursor [Panicum miliaceum]|uniref:Receptor-like serine-threonine protein kinase n=1 Tax=Panicum miliaceum TaxID=4540 RepID=A0A3L6SP57_PANMI|nr:receptor-like serine-threonine protein kinase precursor [Panicum miliaceum]
MGGIAIPDLLDPEDKKLIEPLAIDLQTLRAATNNFHLDNKLGEGGFGTIYKEIIEVKNELVLLAKLQHRNLVRVRVAGVCLEEEHENLIVYEYLPNRSLDNLIYGNAVHG